MRLRTRRRQRKAARARRAATKDTKKALGRLGAATRDFATSGGEYARHRSAITARAVRDSDAADRVRGGTSTARRTAHRAKRKASRWYTIALVGGLAFLYQQVRSQPVRR